MRELLLICIVLPFAFVALKRPVVGMLTFVWLGFFVPQNFTWGSSQLSLLMALCTIVGYMFSPEPKKFPHQREAILLLMLWALFAITTPFAIFPDRALRTLILVSKIFLMVYLSMCILNNEDRLHSLIRIIALSLGFYAVGGAVFAVVSGGQYIVFGPDNSFLAANNMIGLALAMNLPLLGYLIKREEQMWLRWICRLMFISSYLSIICTYSRGAWLGLAVVTALMAIRSRYKVRLTVAAAIFLIVFLPFALTLVPERAVNRYEDLRNYETESSAQMRFGSWTYCWRVGVAHPLTGGGFNHNSIVTYNEYNPDYHKQWGMWWLRSACHSSWLTMISNHGFIGTLLWIGLIGSVFLSSWRVRSLTKANPELSWMSDLASALQISLVVFAVVGTFIDAQYFDMLYYLIAILVILKELIQNAPELARKTNIVAVHDARRVVVKSPVPG